MEKKAVYDTLGDTFKELSSTEEYRAIETRTLMGMAGDVRGLHVLDLACGFGFYSRSLMAKGAASVVGVDISEKMITLAREESRKNGDNIQYHVRNVADLEVMGAFDLVLAVWLFNYAESPADLLCMFQAIARNLKPGGRLVAYTLNPDFNLSKGPFTGYAIDILTEEPWQGGFRHQAQFAGTTSSPFTVYRWRREDYARTVRETGLYQLQWQQPRLIEDDLKRHAPGFWDAFQQNCPQIALACRKA